MFTKRRKDTKKQTEERGDREYASENSSTDNTSLGR